MGKYYVVHRDDELYHYGVPGMKWGVRKGPRSLSGTANRALAGVYGMNQRFWNKAGNKTAAGMQATARKQALKRAAAADQAKARKIKAVGEAKASYKEAKAARKGANKDFNKSYNKAYGYSQRHLISQNIKRSKNYQTSQDNWNDVINKAETYRNARKEEKARKAAYKSARRGR